LGGEICKLLIGRFLLLFGKSFPGREVEMGEAVLLSYETRQPRREMDRMAPGLQARMSQGRQGVLAEVIRSGRIRAGNAIRPVQGVRR
jgi:MOSC domain-containing protein YiiM